MSKLISNISVFFLYIFNCTLLSLYYFHFNHITMYFIRARIQETLLDQFVYDGTHSHVAFPKLHDLILSC